MLCSTQTVERFGGNGLKFRGRPMGTAALRNIRTMNGTLDRVATKSDRLRQIATRREGTVRLAAGWYRGRPDSAGRPLTPILLPSRCCTKATVKRRFCVR
jgi:hypothetical protein